jgi:hypothetical protein
MDLYFLGCFQCPARRQKIHRCSQEEHWRSAGSYWQSLANARSVVLKALPLDWMEQSVVPLEMVFRVRRSYSGTRQSATYQLASAESAFECLVEAQECLAEF